MPKPGTQWHSMFANVNTLVASIQEVCPCTLSGHPTYSTLSLSHVSQADLSGIPEPQRDPLGCSQNQLQW